MTTGEQIVRRLRESESMAREGTFEDGDLAAWIDAAVAGEREACAKVADEFTEEWRDFDQYSNEARFAASRCEIAEAIAEHIRARAIQNGGRNDA